MRKERKMETQATKATKNRTSKGLRNVYAVIETKPLDDVTLFQRTSPKRGQSPSKFARENRLEVSSFGLLYGKGARANYPLRFINKHQLNSARRLKLGDTILIFSGEMSYRPGRAKTEVHIRDFIELARFQRLYDLPSTDMIYNINRKLHLMSFSAM